MKDEIKEILNQLEIVARKHTIEVCEDGSKIEFMSASVVDELRLNNYGAKLLLDYITNLQEKYDKALTDLVHESHTRIKLERKITNLKKEKKKYEKFLNELRKIVNGELVPRYHTNSERAKFHFNEGWSLFKSFVEDRMAKFIGDDKDVKD